MSNKTGDFDLRSWLMPLYDEAMNDDNRAIFELYRDLFGNFLEIMELHVREQQKIAEVAALEKKLSDIMGDIAISQAILQGKVGQG